MGSSTQRIADEQAPAHGGETTNHRIKKQKKRHRRRDGYFAKAREGVVGLVFALQLLAALVGLVLVPLYLIYELIIN